MNRKNAKLLGRALRGIQGTDGYATYGTTRKATLFIGRAVGLSTGPQAEGSVLPENKVTATVMAHRIEQVGLVNASSTVVSAKGFYQGGKEPSVKIEIVDTGADKGKFQANVKRLAETTAKELGQREVIIEWQDGKKTTTATASPTGAPQPTSPQFCDWIRRNSESARSNPRDACYSKPKGKKP